MSRVTDRIDGQSTGSSHEGDLIIISNDLSLFLFIIPRASAGCG